jgi:pectinesterase
LGTTSTSTQIIFIEEGTYDEQVYIPSLAGKLIIYGQTEEYALYSLQHLKKASLLMIQY